MKIRHRLPSVSAISRRPLAILPDQAAPILASLQRAEAMMDRGGDRASGLLARLLGREGDDVADFAGPDVPVAALPLWSAGREIQETDEYAWSLIDGIAYVKIDTALSDEAWTYCGCLYWGYDLISALLRQFERDERVRGVFLRFDSPGGMVTGCAACANEIAAFTDKTGKPVHVSASLAASAAYWLAAGASRLTGDAHGIVGSIGVVLTHMSAAGWLKREGLKITAIQFGAKKTDGAPWKDLPEATRAEWQADIDDIGQDFCEFIAERRGLQMDEVLALEAGIFQPDHRNPARSGLALGLVDAVETEEQAFEALLNEIETLPDATLPAGQAAAPARAEGPQQRQVKENQMKKTDIAALQRAAAKGDKAAARNLADWYATLSAASAAEEEDDEEDAPEMQTDPDAPKEEEDPAAEDDEDEDGEDEDGNDPEAVLALAAAKGREALAGRLALKVASGKLSVAEAESLLAASPKGSGSLGERVTRDMAKTGDKPVNGSADWNDALKQRAEQEAQKIRAVH